jgi:hypothetical protein
LEKCKRSGKGLGGGADKESLEMATIGATQRAKCAYGFRCREGLAGRCNWGHTEAHLEHFEAKREGQRRERDEPCGFCLQGCCRFGDRCWRGLGSDSEYSSSGSGSEEEAAPVVGSVIDRIPAGLTPAEFDAALEEIEAEEKRCEEEEEKVVLPTPRAWWRPAPRSKRKVRKKGGRLEGMEGVGGRRGRAAHSLAAQAQVTDWQAQVQQRGKGCGHGMHVQEQGEGMEQFGEGNRYDVLMEGVESEGEMEMCGTIGGIMVDEGFGSDGDHGAEGHVSEDGGIEKERVELEVEERCEDVGQQVGKALEVQGGEGRGLKMNKLWARITLAVKKVF